MASSLHEWAIRLAREVSPAEEEIAPLLLDAFLAGGASRATLFKIASDLPGAYGPVTLSNLMPYVFVALSSVGVPIVASLNSKEKLLEHWVGMLKTGLSIFELNKKSRMMADAHQEAPAPSAYEPLFAAMEKMSAELAQRGISPDQSDAITVRVMRSLFEKPESAAAFIRELSAER